MEESCDFLDRIQIGLARLKCYEAAKFIMVELSEMLSVLRRALSNWLLHRGPRLGAALAYYAVFSLGPLILLVSAVAGYFLGSEAVSHSVASQYRSVVGDAGAKAIDAMIQGAASTSGARSATIVGIALLIVAAIGIVVQLKDALNTVWQVENSSEADGGSWMSYIRSYAIAVAGVLALGFLLAVSLLLSTALAAAATILAQAEEGALWQVLETIVSLGILTVLFALMFKYLPDTVVAWRSVWPGAFLTAILFQAGKLVIAWYVGTQGLESTYGAASSLVVLLIWIYYAAQILLFGAEVTHVLAEDQVSAVGGRAEAR